MKVFPCSHRRDKHCIPFPFTLANFCVTIQFLDVSKGCSSVALMKKISFVLHPQLYIDLELLELHFKMRTNQGIKNLNQGQFINEIANSSNSSYSWSYSHMHGWSYSKIKQLLQFIKYSFYQRKKHIDRQIWLTFVYTQFTSWDPLHA